MLNLNRCAEPPLFLQLLKGCIMSGASYRSGIKLKPAISEGQICNVTENRKPLSG